MKVYNPIADGTPSSRIYTDKKKASRALARMKAKRIKEASYMKNFQDAFYLDEFELVK